MTDQINAARFANVLETLLKQVKPDAVFRWKRMFGGAAYYADEKMFAGWYRSDSVALKLAEVDRDELLQVEGAQQAMGKQSVEVPQEWLDDTSQLSQWLEKSLAYVASLPTKKKRQSV